MSTRMPVVFLSHGAPDIVLQPQAATLAYWRHLGEILPRPKAILVISAHWETTTPTLSTAIQPPTIYDFAGFPRALYQMRYPAAGAPDLAATVASFLTNAGLTLQLDAQRGLDHGAWIPLSMMYPQADIPVTQLSIQPQQHTQWHMRLGQALQPLRDQGILLLATGSITHNFAWLSRRAEPLPQALAFSTWLSEQVQSRDTTALLDYRRLAPYGAESHPTDEHLLPLYVAYGASTADDVVTHTSPEFTYGGLAMDGYVWAAANSHQ